MKHHFSFALFPSNETMFDVVSLKEYKRKQRETTMKGN